MKIRTGDLMRLLILCVLLVPAGVNAQNAEPTAKEIVNNVQAFYAGAEDYQAEFTQTTSHKMFSGKYQRAYGKVLFKKGGLMRWEYKRPATKLFVYDGSILWVYEPEVPQVFKGTADADRLRKALAFLTGDGKITDSYTAKKVDAGRYGFAKGYVLRLKPREKNSPFSHVELYVDKTTFRVIRSVVVDHDGNRNRLDFASPIINAGLNPQMFQFAPPAGVPVIEAQ